RNELLWPQVVRQMTHKFFFDVTLLAAHKPPLLDRPPERIPPSATQYPDPVSNVGGFALAPTVFWSHRSSPLGALALSWDKTLLSSPKAAGKMLSVYNTIKKAPPHSRPGATAAMKMS